MSVALPVLLVCAGCGPSTPAENKSVTAGKVRTPETGHVENNTYTNEYFHFSLSVPDGWSVPELGRVNGIEKEWRNQTLNSKSLGMRAVAGDAPSPSIFMMSRSPIEPWVPDNQYFIIMAARLPKVTSRRYLEQASKIIIGSKTGFTQKGEIIDRVIGNLPYCELTLVLTTAERSMVQRQIAIADGTYILVFTLTAPSEIELGVMEAVLSSAKFD